MKAVVSALVRLLDWAALGGGLVAGLMMVSATVIICYDVVLRYAFNAPTNWVFEYTVYLLIGSTYLALGYVTREDAQIEVHILTSRLPPRPRWALAVLTMSLGLCFAALLTVAGWEKTVSAYQLGMTAPTPLRTPLYIPRSVIPIGGGLLALQLARRLILALAMGPVFIQKHGSKE